MGRRDYRHRETKKPKKEDKASGITSVISETAPVEVIKTKGKKEKPTEE